MAQFGEDLAAAAQRPGLHVSAADDHFVGTIDIQRRAAERAGARIEVLEGLGHWWMVQDPHGELRRSRASGRRSKSHSGTQPYRSNIPSASVWKSA